MKDDNLIPAALMVLIIAVMGNAIAAKKPCKNSDLPLCKLTGTAEMAKPSASLIQPHPSSSALFRHHRTPPLNRVFLSVWITKKSRTRALPALMT